MAVLEKTERHTPPEVKRTRGKWLRLLTGDQLQMQTMIWPGLILCRHGDGDGRGDGMDVGIVGVEMAVC